MKAVRCVLAILLLVGCPALGAAQPPKTPPEQQTEYVPLSERPPQEELPSATLVMVAYSFVVLALFAYLFSLSSRLGAVKREIERLERQTHRAP